MEFPRQEAPELNADEDPFEFQVLDWFIPEADRAQREMQKGQPYMPSEDEPDVYDIFMYGVNHEGHSVTVKVSEFQPYFYVKPPKSWWTRMSTKVQELRYTLREEKVVNQQTGMQRYIIPRRLIDHLVHVKAVMRKDFWGFTNGRDFPFIELKVKSLALFNVLKRYFTTRVHEGFQMYESNIDPFLRFIHDRNLRPCAWVRLEPCCYDIVEGDEKFARTSYNIKVRASDVHPIDIQKIAPLLIASFDIECTSSHGDFPVAKKNYRKLAMDLAEVAKKNPDLITPENVWTWILTSFIKPQEVEYVTIHQVFPIQKTKQSSLARELTDVLTPITETLQEIANGSQDTKEDAEDNEEEDEEDFKPLSSKAMGELEDKVCRILTATLPRLKGDAVIQIGTTVHRYGSDDIIYRHIAVLNSCDPIENAEVESFDTEEDMIIGWRDFIQRLDPDILTGYNIFGFDMDYLWSRSVELGIDDNLRVGLGRLIERKTTLIESKLSSSALGDNILKYIDMDGVVSIDLYKLMQREQKLDSYKLDNVAKVFLGDQKNDLSPKELFAKYLGNSADRCDIAKYCLQDCALVNRLMHKLKVMENNIGMGNVCSVPLSYLFMRGQGVKIFSLVAKECRMKNYLVPALNNYSETIVDDEGYEGAIVLEPKEGIYLEDPITVLDYSSLYPSSMIARNLSHDCIVTSDEYAHLEDEGITYEKVTFDVYEGIGDKKHAVGKKTCVFAQLPDGKKGIIPSILMQLLTARKNTRKKIEYERLELSDGRVAVGLVKELEDGKLEIVNVEQGHKATIETNLVIRREQAFNSFEQAVLDALQLAYKITANSLYGQIGARTSPIYWKDIAACTTATGREMILTAKNFVEKEYNAEVVYGDSVTGYTPMLIRFQNMIQFETIETLAEKYGNGKWTLCQEEGKQEKESCELHGVESWTDDGWTKVHRVIRHQLASHKKIIRVNTHHGVVDVTDDHSLLRLDKSEATPKDLKVGDAILHHEYPELGTDQFNELWDNDHVAMATIAFLAHVHDFHTVFDVDTHGTISMNITNNAIIDGNTIKKLHEIPYQGYVYDVTTDNHHFQAGVGKIIVHNTDSIFVRFSHHDSEGKKITGIDALPLAIKAGQRTSKEIKKLLPPPQCLEYEKTFYPFILFSKKRYVGNLYEDDPNKKPKQKSMGIVLKRRDNAPVVKHIFGGIIDIILNQHNLVKSVHFLQEKLQELVDGKVPLEDLILTKTLKGSYKNPNTIAHKVLAERMGMRDPGNKPAVNDRIPFAYIIPPPGVEVNLQGDRVEHPDFIRAQNLKPDYRFYITNQLQKPICQLYALCVEELPQYSFPPGYWEQIEEELMQTPLYGNSEKKRKDRISALRMKEVDQLLFAPFKNTLIEVKKKKKTTAGTKKIVPLPVMNTPCMVVRLEVKDDKKNKEYHGSIKAFSPQGEALHSWEEVIAKKKKGTTIQFAYRMVAELAFQKMHEAYGKILRDQGLRFEVANATFLRTWKQALTKSEEYRESMQKAIAEQDIGRFNELREEFMLFNLMEVSESIPYRLEAAPKSI